MTKFPLRLTKTRKISRFFLKQSRFLFEKKKKKINLTTFNKTGKKKTFSSYKKKRKILFAGHPRKAF